MKFKQFDVYEVYFQSFSTRIEIDRRGTTSPGRVADLARLSRRTSERVTKVARIGIRIYEGGKLHTETTAFTNARPRVGGRVTPTPYKVVDYLPDSWGPVQALAL